MQSSKRDVSACLRVKQGLYSFLLLTAWGWHDYGQNSGQYLQHIHQRAELEVGRYETVCKVTGWILRNGIMARIIIDSPARMSSS